MLRLIVDLVPRDPSYGLALEEAVLESARSERIDTIRFWVNDRSVIIGRSQSAEAEANLILLQRKHIPLLRRLSGGGTVYHYPGNLNISVFLTSASYQQDISDTYISFGRALVRGLSLLDVRAKADRNAILLSEKKIAGAAQVRGKHALLYHTTFLVSPPLIPFETLLLAMQKDYYTSLVASRPLPMTSLSQVLSGITVADLVEPFGESLARLVGQTLQEERYSSRELNRARILHHEKYGSDRWNLSR